MPWRMSRPVNVLETDTPFVLRNATMSGQLVTDTRNPLHHWFQYDEPVGFVGELLLRQLRNFNSEITFDTFLLKKRMVG